MKSLVIFLFAAALSAQTVKPALPVAKPDTKAIYTQDYPLVTAGTFTIWKYATATDKLTADGHGSRWQTRYALCLERRMSQYPCGH